MAATHLAPQHQATLLSLAEGNFILHFMVADVQCCLPIDYIQRIVTLTDIFKAPKAPAYMVGMLNLHGQAIPVIDPCMYLQLGTPESYTTETSIIVCSYNRQLFGLTVKQVKEIDSIHQADLQLNESKDTPFTGTLNSDNKISFILDIAYLAKCCAMT